MPLCSSLNVAVSIINEESFAKNSFIHHEFHVDRDWPHLYFQFHADIHSI